MKSVLTLVLFAPALAGAATLQLSGTVRFADTTPIVGAQVHAKSGSVDNVATTGAGGAYAITVASGTYSIDVSYSDTGFSTGGRTDVASISLTDDTVHDITVPSIVVNGHVVDATAAPVANVRLTALAFTQSTGVGGFDSIDVTSDASGNFTLRMLPNSYLNLVLTPPTPGTYVTTKLPDRAINAAGTQSFVIAKPVTISGHVKYADNSVAAGVTISAGDSAATSSAVTDSLGAYSLSIAPGTWDLSAGFSNASFSTSGRNVATGVVASANLVRDLVIPSIKLHGRVVDASATPVANVQFYALAFAQSTCCGGFDNITATSAADGTFDVVMLPNSYLNMRLTPPAGPYVTTPLPDQSFAADTTQDYVISRSKTLSGNVTYSDGPAAVGATVNACAGSVSYSVVAGAGGAYSVDVAPQTYAVAVGFTRGGFSSSGRDVATGVVVGSNLTRDLVVPTILLSGHVVDQYGRDVAGAIFTGLAFSQATCNGGFDNINVTSDASGHFALRILANSYQQLTLTPTLPGVAATAVPDHAWSVDTTETFVMQADPADMAEPIDMAGAPDDLAMSNGNADGGVAPPPDLADAIGLANPRANGCGCDIGAPAAAAPSALAFVGFALAVFFRRRRR